MSETPDTPADNDDSACENKKRDNPLRIVRRADDAELDLGLDETEIDRRYGREDIADK